ncbi:MFS transporter [Ramlibacter sp.]|uniref:MFS transporter n=1 Tax=Ramlibacter sp. TaxID=1917967 RepID=UPI002CA61F56|nr:MFS transporter [Ramlibacter sp.]HWI82145.1 MFS transporter [Ramlibacter sp.]
MLVIILGITLTVLDASMINLALPGIARDLRAAPSDSILVVNAYQIATLALLLPCAALGDRLSYRRVYLVGMAVYAAGSLASMLAPSLPVLIAARALQGLGAAGIMAVNPALVRLTYPARMLGRGIALNSVVVATSAVAGPSVAAGVLSIASWHWLFALNIPLGLLLLALGTRALPRNVARAAAPARLRIPDVVLNVLFFALMFVGMNMLSGSPGQSSHSAPPLAGLAVLALGLAIGAFYVQRQRKEALPLFPVDLLRIRVFGLSMLTSISAFGAQVLTFIALPFLMLDVWHLSALHAGLLLTAWPCGVVIAAPLAATLIGRYHGGALAGAGLALLCVGLALLALMAGAPSTAQIAWRLLVCGFGFGLFQSPNNHTIVTSAPLHRAGAASGMLATARIAGQTTGAVLVTLIFSLAGTAGGRGPRAAIGLAALLAAVSAVFSAARARKPQPQGAA